MDFSEVIFFLEVRLQGGPGSYRYIGKPG